MLNEKIPVSSVSDKEPVAGLVENYKTTLNEQKSSNEKISDDLNNFTRGKRDEDAALIAKFQKEFELPLKNEDMADSSPMDIILPSSFDLDKNNESVSHLGKQQEEKKAKYSVSKDEIAILYYEDKVVSCQKNLDHAQEIFNLSPEELKEKYGELADNVKNEYLPKIIQFNTKLLEDSKKIAAELKKVKEIFEKKEKEKLEKQEAL